ncbi:MAG TPA: tRNA epoxyqueuosine(34) reductase QueG [Chloroflexota bacterium]|nr:tRNA epoxyqueuosine(34) reductase QueG [Chloroflexota bacterium]
MIALEDPGNVPRERALAIKSLAREAGFDAVGIARATPFGEARRFLRERIAGGAFSGLPWFNAERADFAADPQNLLPGVRSIVAVALSYRTEEPAPEAGMGPRGKVARYAWARDYHPILKERMAAVVTAMHARYGAGECRTLVDTARIVDRAAAQRAGTGWYGKNTNIINPTYGSWVLLGEILTTLELAPDPPLRKHCGSCRLCLDACPTGALTGPYSMDNNRCISYLTIEHKGVIPRELRPLIGDWIFGCDICQEVCPPALKGQIAHHPPFRASSADAAFPALIPLLAITEDEFRARFAGSPIKRAKREGLQRNVAVALGNSGDHTAVPALVRALATATPLVRGHAAWALGRLGGPAATAALRQHCSEEDDPWVREEIGLALAGM